MKPAVVVNEERVKAATKRINDSREPKDDWQIVLKMLISQIQDDFVRLQHPSRRDQVYLKEAFCSAIAALWDADYTFSEFKNEKGEDMTFRELMATRFGIAELSKDEIHKIDLGPLQKECINEAKEYWIDKNLNIVEVSDFLIFDGRAFSVWRTDEESSIDYDNMIINLENSDDERELSETFIKLSMEIAAYYRDMKIKPETIEELAKAWYELLRLNSCFRQR